MQSPKAETSDPPLKGLGWEHPRGVDCLEAADELLRAQTGISVSWSARSLQAFGDDTTLEQFEQYDLISIDHPHVPAAVEQGYLVALDEHRASEVFRLGAEGVGPSHDSYAYRGHQWALATDAAAQVSAFRADLIDRAPIFWNEVFTPAFSGRVLWPYKPVDAISTFLTLCAQLGAPVQLPGTPPSTEIVDEVVELLLRLVGAVPDWCAQANPIDIAEVLAGDDGYTSAVALYGYSNYSRPGFRAHAVTYDDIPSFDGLARGAILGGAGLAVSSRSRRIDDTITAALFLSSAQCQPTAYFDGGGQPGNVMAWRSHRVNSAAGHFFANTQRTIEGAWVRPQHPSWPAAQLTASHLLHDGLTSGSWTRSMSTRLAATLSGTEGADNS